MGQIGNQYEPVFVSHYKNSDFLVCVSEKCPPRARALERLDILIKIFFFTFIIILTSRGIQSQRRLSDERYTPISINVNNGRSESEWDHGFQLMFI